jgi:predicted RNase H-like nuclease (RuvC/YqgF family)
MELWRQEHRAGNFIIYLFALAIAIGAGYFACEKHLAKEFGKNEGQNFSNIKNLVKPLETTLAGMDLRDKEIKGLCQQIKDQQDKIQNLGTVVEELRKGAAESSQGDKKEKEAWLEKMDKTNQNLQAAIKEMEQLKNALSNQEKNFKEIINKDIKSSLDKIKAELEANKKASAPVPTPVKPEITPTISEEENKPEKEGEKK